MRKPLVISYQEPLTPYSTMRLPAQAQQFISITQTQQMKQVISQELLKRQPFYLLGGGSKTVFTQDFPGIIVKIDIAGIEILQETDTFVDISVGAGENWHQLTEYTVKNNWSGMENMALIPGDVGGATIQNAGAYGQEFADICQKIRGIDLDNGQEIELPVSECHYQYRDSIFKHELKNKIVITTVILRLKKRFDTQTKNFLQQKTVNEELESFAQKPYQLRDVFQAIVQLRQKKLPDIRKIGSVGCFYKNPLVDQAVFEKIKEKDPNIPHYPQVKDEITKIKIPGGYFLDQLGWKGKRIGECGIWDKHALIIVNYGQATASDILDLDRKMRQDCLNQYGIELEHEAILV